MKKLNVIEGDITKVTVEAIVNAANNTLMGGGGVDGAIHRAAGPKLLEECKGLRGCNTGEAKITRGYNLPAKWIIHTVGPVWNGGNDGEDDLLANCYKNALKLAVEYGIKTLAFPSISTGAYRFPVSRAARITIREMMDFLEENKTVDRIFIVCFDTATYDSYIRAVEELGG